MDWGRQKRAGAVNAMQNWREENTREMHLWTALRCRGSWAASVWASWASCPRPRCTTARWSARACAVRSRASESRRLASSATRCGRKPPGRLPRRCTSCDTDWQLSFLLSLLWLLIRVKQVSRLFIYKLGRYKIEKKYKFIKQIEYLAPRKDLNT